MFYILAKRTHSQEVRELSVNGNMNTGVSKKDWSLDTYLPTAL